MSRDLVMRIYKMNTYYFALIFYQILSTHSLRKYIKISLENLYVDIMGLKGLKQGLGQLRNGPCATYTSPIMHLICPPKFCISIVLNFSSLCSMAVLSLLPRQSPRGFSALAGLYYLAHPTKTAMLCRLQFLLRQL